jgi:hypothetical protein
MAHVVESQVGDSEHVTNARKSGAHGARVVWKDVFARAWLILYDRPAFSRVLEAPVVAFLIGRVFRVTNNPGPRRLIIVSPLEPAYFGLPSGGMKRKAQDGRHRYFGATVPPGKEFKEPLKLLGRRTARASSRLRRQPEGTAGAARFQRHLRMHRHFFNASGSAQDDADPRQIIGDRCGPGAVGAARTHVVDQLSHG